MSVTPAMGTAPAPGRSATFAKPAPGLLPARQESITYARIALEVWRQAYMVVESGARGKGGGESFLATRRFSDSGVAMGITLRPDELEALVHGVLPPQYSPEETAQRIADICLLSNHGRSSASEWAAYAEGLVERAYLEVSDMVGELPEQVLETRSRVLAILRAS